MKLLLGIGIAVSLAGSAFAFSLDFGESCPGLTDEECRDVIAEIEIDGVYCQGQFIGPGKALYKLCRQREELMIQLNKAEKKHCAGTDTQSQKICASLREDIISEAVRRLNYLTDDNMEN
jgi:hypothetical protein